ncbi:MAG: hypothetical protein AAF664_19600 [Planctomycetota bacterium]
MPALSTNHSDRDWTFATIEFVGRFLRILFETSLLCIAGTLVFVAFQGMLIWIIFFVAGDEWSWMEQLPSFGWWIGFAVSIFRSPSLLSKPVFQIVETTDSERPAKTDQPTSVVRSPTLATRWPKRLTSLWKGLGFGLFVGAFLGLLFSVSVCIILTAALLCPIAPDSWQEGWTNEIAEPSIMNHRPAKSKGMTFWHPIFGWVIGACLGGSMLVSTFGFGVAGWLSDSDKT